MDLRHLRIDGERPSCDRAVFKGNILRELRRVIWLPHKTILGRAAVKSEKRYAV